MKNILIIIIFFSNLLGYSQQRYAYSIPNLNGDYGKEYIIDTVNFKAYAVSQQSSLWKIFSIDLNNGITSDLSIQTNGEINSMFFRNDSLYFGGNFTVVNGNSTNYRYFGVYNTKSNSLLPGMNPSLNGSVSAIHIHENKLVIGGNFTSVLSIPTKKIVFLNFSSSPLTISSAYYGQDLIDYLNNNSGSITKFKSRDVHLFFILDKKHIYGFTPFSMIYANIHKYSCSVYGSPADEAIYDYTFINSRVYVVGNLMMNTTGLNINSLIINPIVYTAPNIGYDKVSVYDMYTGDIYYSNDIISNQFDSSPNAYTNTVPYGALFGCTGINFKYNQINLVFSRSNYPSTGKNSILKVNSAIPISNISQLFYSEKSNTPLGGSMTQYNTLHNLQTFSNILAVFSSHIDYHGGSYWPMASKNDSIYILRDRNAVINGFILNPGSVCRGDTVKIKLRKQGNLKQYQWFYSGSGMSIIHASGDSALIKFNYSASPGQLKIVAKDNFNFPTDTFRYSISFKPLPNINAGADKYLTCKNNSVKVTATTNLTNYNLDWITPNGFTNLDSLSSVSIAGNYIVRIKDNITSCYNYDTLKILYDTLKPLVNWPSINNYTLTCKNNSRMITINSVNPLDTVYWYGEPRYKASAVKQVFSPGRYYATCISFNNGCKKTDSINIVQNINLPPVSSNVLSDSITCKRDSVYLNGFSVSSAILYWKKPNQTITDSISNPIYSKLIGYHSLTAYDTITGCKQSTLINVVNRALNPLLSLTSNIESINCSFSNTLLSFNYASPNTDVLWEGPQGYVSTNPAQVSNIGTYTITVTDTINGCKTSDTVRLFKQNILKNVTLHDTIICPKDSITISLNPIGGIPPYSYYWTTQQNTPSIKVSPSQTSTYIVYYSDNSNCGGSDTLVVNVPDLISDSTVTFQPCDPFNPNGQIQVFTKGGIPPYIYNLNNQQFQQSNVFPNLSFGTYTIQTKDAIGCQFSSTADISNASLAPKSDFIVSTNLFKKDTFVIVDISNPKPDQVNWVLPSNFIVIDSSDIFSPIIYCQDTGQYIIQQKAYFGDCKTINSKLINIKYNDGSYATSYNNNGIKDILIYPNPNNGQFNLQVEMFKKQKFGIFINDINGIEKVRLIIDDLDIFNGNINIPNPVNGTYIIKVISSYDSKHISFVISQ